MIWKGLLLFGAFVAACEASVKVTRTSGNLAEFEVTLPSQEKLLLHMQKSTKFQNLPVTVSENGVARTFSSKLLHDASYERYTSADHKAVLSANNVNGKMQYQGHFSHKGLSYLVEPTGEGKHHVSYKKGPVDSVIESKNFKSRVRRQTMNSPTTYVIELYLLLDNKVWEHFTAQNSDENAALTQLHKYYTHILDGIDIVYRNIGTPSISVECVGLFVAKTAADAGWISASVLDGAKILDTVESYYKSKGIKADHVMAFTRYDIYGDNGDGTKNQAVCGMAPVSATCDEARVSINEDSGLQSWATAAHELGHNMASRHDGSSNACTSATKNIMAPGLGIFTESDVKNSVRLSDCSVQYMNSYISSLSTSGKNCLTTKVGSRLEVFKTPAAIGAQWNLDKVCKQAYGSSSGFFKTTEQATKPALICASIYCTSASGGGQTRSGMRAPVGEPCGDRKSCSWDGACVSDLSAPAADEKCFFGDSDTLANCQGWLGAMQGYPAYCDEPSYKTYVKTQCCKTCASVCN